MELTKVVEGSGREKTENMISRQQKEKNISRKTILNTAEKSIWCGLKGVH